MTLLCVSEFMRFILVFIFSGTLTVELMISLCELLKNMHRVMVLTVRNDEEKKQRLVLDRSYFLIKQLRIIRKIFDESLAKILCVSLLCAHLIIVVLSWVLLMCWGYVSEVIMCVIAVLVIYILIVTYELLVESSMVRYKSRQLLGKKQRLYYYFKFRLGQRGKQYYLQWMAERPVYLKCGQYFVLKRDTMIQYFFQISMNFSNAVLLFKPV